MKLLFSFIIVSILLVTARADQQQPQSIPRAGLSILFIFGGLLYSGILKAMCDKVNIPLNPLLLITGIILGKYYEHLGFLGDATKLMSQLNPNGILAIFLPTLIFQSAFKSQWYMLKKQFGQTIILGVICTIVAAFIIMAAIKIFVGYDDDIFNWRQAFLLATTLCCTDIFSFVGKLKQYGTPQMLISLIQGESLFNYCTCVLIFQITNQVIIDYEERVMLDIIPLLLMQTLGGVFFGLLFGFIALFFLKRISSNGVLVVTIMIIFCYTIYMLMEFTAIKVSGIIALVTYGIFMGAFGKAHLVGQASVAMESFWSYAVFIAQTSIFLIAGVLVGLNAFRNQTVVQIQTHIIPFVQVYVIVLIARYLAILIFQPRLSSLGYGMQWKQSLIISYGGLKGAIGISFAMIVFQNNQYAILTRNLFLLHVTTNSLLTLLINGMTTGFLINILKISNLTKIQYKFFKQYIQNFKQRIEDKKNDMIGQKYLNTVDWQQINTKIGINQLNKLQAQIDTIILKNNFKSSSRLEKKQMYYLQQTLQQFSNRNNKTNNVAQQQYQQHNTKYQIIIQIRKRFIKGLKYRYWIYHQEHNTMPDAVMLLLQSANVDLDMDTQAIESWAWIKNQITYNIRFVSELRKNYFIGSLAREYLFNYISYCYDIVSSYIQANQEARQQFKQIKFGGFNEEAVRLIMRQSQDNQKQAEQFLYNQLKPSFPEIEQEVVTRKASFNLLLSFQNIIDTYNQSGQLQTSQFQLLFNLINRKKTSLELHSPNWKAVSLKQSLKQDKVFGLLPDKILTVLQHKLSIFNSYGSKQIIQTSSNIAKYIYFIRRGGCSIQLVNGNLTYKQTLIVGDIYGWESLLSSTYRSTITTNTLMISIGVRKNYIEKIMDYFPDFQQAFWKQNLFSLLKMYSSNKQIALFMSYLDKDQLREAINSFKLKRLQVGQHIIQQDCIIFRGKCQIQVQPLENPEQLQPLTFLHQFQNQKLYVIQKLSLLVGKFPIPEQDNRFTVNLNSASKKRNFFYPKRSLDSSIITSFKQLQPVFTQKA